MAEPTQKAAHTPGPWRWTEHGLVGPNTEFPGGRYIIAVTEHDSAPASNDWRYSVVEPENGPLIAAAPDLYAALERVLPTLEAEAEETSQYGHFPGGDPRKFSPDEESNTPEEIAAWKAACEKWNAGEQVDDGSHGCKPIGIGGAVGFACGSSFGVGVYQYADSRAVADRDAARAALAKARGEVPA